MLDDTDDDDAPLIFRRTSTSSSSKQSQPHKDGKKPAGIVRDYQSERLSSDDSSARLPSSNSHNGKNTPLSQPSVSRQPEPSMRQPLPPSRVSRMTPTPPCSQSKNLSKMDGGKEHKDENMMQQPVRRSSVEITQMFGDDDDDDDEDDDDAPLIFRRTAPSNQRHPGPGVKKASSDHTTPSFQNSNSQNGEMVSPFEKSAMKHAQASRRQPSPSLVTSRLASMPMGSQFKHPSKLDVPHTGIKNEGVDAKPSVNAQNLNSNAAAADGDDKPLHVRGSISKEESRAIIQTPCTTNDVHLPGEKSEPSDDDVPLATRYQLKSNSGAVSTSRPLCDSTKPLISKLHCNGSSGNNCFQGKSSSSLNKRLLTDGNSSSAKRARPDVGSTPLKIEGASVKEEVKTEDEDDIPISQRIRKLPMPVNSSVKKLKVEATDSVKEEVKKEDEDNTPIHQRMIKKVSAPGSKSLSSKPKAPKSFCSSSSSMRKTTKTSKREMKSSGYRKFLKVPPGSGEGQKWTTLEHNGVIFPPPYQSHGVKMLYDGKPVELTQAQEEVATMFAVMKDSDYATKPKFIDNFMGDWRKILGRNHVIKEFERCDFTPIYEWHLAEKEKKKQMTTEEKKLLKEEKMEKEDKYMWAVVDGVKEKVGNFRVEPPGLFRGRGEHPKMGKLKRRIQPSEITINIGEDAVIPECPVEGETWREIKHDNTVTWLAFWNDPINTKEFKYVFLAASSSLKGQSDREKYEKARVLKDYIDGIREAYTKDFANKDFTGRQIAVATYLIDKLALRAGNEKDDDEADTVGCCTLKVENVIPKPPNILHFDFLGKDSIRYENQVVVVLPVFRAIEQFQVGKRPGDDLFDRLDTGKLNAHLKELMPGLTAKVFRTYNASSTLDEELEKATREGVLAEKVTVYQQANKKVAIICNHQRTISKSHSAQMTKLDEKIEQLRESLAEMETDLSRAKKGKPPLDDEQGNRRKALPPETIERKIQQLRKKIDNIELNKRTKEDLKTVALGTSKINYCDPRITVAWCKRHEVPIEKMFNKSLLAKFAWAMDVEPDYKF